MKMTCVDHLRCVVCGATYAPETRLMCELCGADGILDVVYDYDKARRSLEQSPLAGRASQTLWRYRELLPVDASSARIPDLSVGCTPLTPAPRLARYLGLDSLLIKDDGRNPTGSLKDRASALAVALACAEGKDVIACSSTGNAASSLAGMAASMGMRSVIFVPKDTPEPKLTQLLAFGATVLRVQGSYYDAFQLCQSACAISGWYNRNCAINPWLVEGKKTVALEICEQLDWKVPDWVAVSVGDGCTIAGIWKGFREFKLLGLIDRTPRMLGVQASGADAVLQAFRSGSLPPDRPENTVADSIKVGVPRNWRKALQAIHESGGTMISVDDSEILEAIGYTGSLSGIFAEPAASTSVAGLRKAVAEGYVDSDASVVTVITGNGLKDTRSARLAVGQPHDVSPDGRELKDLLAGHGYRG
jgi:threonine synthase